MAITAVLFDLDDTLFDHSACTRAALAALRERVPAFGALPVEPFEAEHRRLLEALHLQVLAGQLTVDDARIERFYEKYGRWRGLMFWLEMTRDWHDEKFRTQSGP